MKLYLYLLIFVLSLACSKNSNSGADSASYEDLEVNEMLAVPASKAYSVSTSREESYEQKIIKESYLRFETQDLDKTYNQIVRFIKQNNGFIQNDNANTSNNRMSRNLEIRIPTANFQNIIDSISSHVLFFDTKHISSRDVTEEFIDLEARLKAKQTLEKRYLELLSKAKSVKEILEIERELSKVREEIESKQGRLKYLQDKVSLSTLNIEFYKVTAKTGVTTSYGSKMVNAIKSGFNGLSLFFLGILHIWPFIIILIIAFFIIKRWLTKRKSK